jgi:hypothetical protein
VPTSTPADRWEKRRSSRRPNREWGGSYDGRNPTQRKAAELSMVSLRQESLGKEEETRTQKPFVGTLRVRIPPGKAGPAARSESCVVVGRPTLRSVDSEVKGRVIEPRNYKPWGAFVLDTGGGRVRRVALGPTGRVWSYRGRRARTMTTRVLQEPESPRRFHRNTGWGDRYRQLPGPRWDAPGRGEQNTGETMVSAREAFETSRDGRRGVGASHSIGEAGEPFRGTPWREGDAMS